MTSITSVIPLLLFHTASSEVIRKSYFNSRYTIYIPDFFLVFFYMTVFLTSALVDRLFFVLICIDKRYFIIGILYATLTLTPFIYSVSLETDHADSIPNAGLKKKALCTLKILLIIFGLDSAEIGRRVLIDAFGTKKKLVELPEYYYSILFFHITNQDLSIIKLYCCIMSEFKSIPQLFVVSIFLSTAKVKGLVVFVALASIFLNSIIFSFTMAVTLPFRKTPRIFKSCQCVVLNSLSKFMATMCACGMNLVIFIMIFNKIGYAALMVHFIRFLWSIWPCWHILKNQSFKMPILYLIFNGFFFAIIFSFLYIHPLEGEGKLFYYYFYLLSFLTEIASIYIFTDASYDIIIIFFTLRGLILGFVSCFGLVNILQKIKFVNNQKRLENIKYRPNSDEIIVS